MRKDQIHWREAIIRAVQQGDPRAQEDLVGYHRQYPEDEAFFHCAQGAIARHERQWARADRHFNAALSLAPGFELVHRLRVDLALARGDLVAAATALEDARRLGCPSSICETLDATIQAEMLELRWERARARGDLKEAQASIEALLELEPDSHQLLANLGDILIELGQDEAAMPLLERAIALGTHPSVLALYGRLLLRRGALRAGAEYLERARNLGLSTGQDQEVYALLTDAGAMAARRVRELGKLLWDSDPEELERQRPWVSACIKAMLPQPLDSWASGEEKGAITALDWHQQRYTIRSLSPQILLVFDHHDQALPPAKGLISLQAQRLKLAHRTQDWKRCIDTWSIINTLDPQRPAPVWLADALWERGDWEQAQALYSCFDPKDQTATTCLRGGLAFLASSDRQQAKPWLEAAAQDQRCHAKASALLRKISREQKVG